MRKIIKKVLLTLVIELAFLFLAMIISFLISRVLPGDPVLAYLPFGPPNQAMYDMMYHQLGLDQPIIAQFFRYAGDMLTGAWGLSLNIFRGAPVWSLIMERLPPTIYLTAIPLILGLLLGYLLGNRSIKVKSIKGNRTVHIVSLLGFALPIITLVVLFQFFLSFINPLFDLVLLWIILSISITAITILLVRMYLINLSKEASVKHSTNVFKLLVGLSYGIVLAFLIQTEIMFSFDGIGDLFLQAISSGDYYVINAIIFLTLISFPIFIVLTLFLFFLFGKLKNKYSLKEVK